ncbi:MAG TPA: hypothetical protein VJV96_13145 [Candidatus Angelobacter sp.]|nr:hypothetical protein [Candidatus Angelobacter sp.]
MTDQEFKEFAHESIHQLMDLNARYHEEFKIDSYERWHYDLETATLTFLHDQVPGVVAQIQAAGSISNKSKSWLWSWANESLPEHVTDSILAVKDWGEQNKVLKLKEDYWSGEEADGWEMAAVANRIIGGRGVYRCPNENGFFFLILTDIRFV